jgi:hypothetical protein
MYQWRKGIARWEVGDTLYLSVPFTWLLDEARQVADAWHGKALIGGPALMEPNTCPGFEPLLFHNPAATFTTRGCPNACPYCAVPKLEGDLREVPDFRPAPVICDNNLLAASKTHIRRVVDRLKAFRYVDFNQGLDARRFTPEIARWLGELRCKVRFAFDYWGMEAPVKDAIDLCRRETTKDIGVYVLIGFNDTPEDAHARLELVRSWGLWPNPMRYQPLDAQCKNDYVALSWTDRELKRMTRYYSRLAWLEGVPFEEYQGEESNQLPLEVNV